MGRDTSGPAFPRPISGNPDHDGMTIRQWYAGLALQAIISKRPLKTWTGNEDFEASLRMARGALEYADALLEELGKP